MFDSYTPHSLPINDYKFIAPYWADVDVRDNYDVPGYVVGGEVFYRQSTEHELLTRATNEIKEVFSLSEDFEITNLFIATWDTAAYFSMHDHKVTICIVIVPSSFRVFDVYCNLPYS